MNQPGSNINFVTVISYNLILAGSLLFTPLVVNALISKGLAQMTGSWLGLASGAAAAFSPGIIAKIVAIKVWTLWAQRQNYPGVPLNASISTVRNRQPHKKASHRQYEKNR